MTKTIKIITSPIISLVFLLSMTNAVLLKQQFQQKVSIYLIL